MKIQIVTEREFPDQEYDNWIRGLHALGVPIDSKVLKEKGEWSFTSVGEAITTYRIIK